jgi:hypothetical protein
MTRTRHGYDKLSPDDLFSLEQYSQQRATFRPQVLQHKKRRTLQVGPKATFLFEPDGAVPGAGDAAHRAHFRSGRHRR